MQETQVWSLGGEDLLEKGMATHSSILARRIPWTEESNRLLSLGSQESGGTEWLILSLSRVEWAGEKEEGVLTDVRCSFLRFPVLEPFPSSFSAASSSAAQAVLPANTRGFSTPAGLVWSPADAMEEVTSEFFGNTIPTGGKSTEQGKEHFKMSCLVFICIYPSSQCS